jgi:hypothetical protein
VYFILLNVKIPTGLIESKDNFQMWLFLIWNIGYRMLNLWGNLLDGPVLGSSHVV